MLHNCITGPFHQVSFNNMCLYVFIYVCVCVYKYAIYCCFTLLYVASSLVGSPFIHVIDALLMPIAYGDGLVHAFEGKPCTFYVNPYGQRGNLSVQIKG